MIKAGIIGGAGYTAGELIRLLINHPEVEIKFINSSSNAGNKITDVHEGLYGETQKGWTADDAKGFIKVTSTALRAYYANHKDEKENI